MDTLVSSTSPHLVKQMHAVSNSDFEYAPKLNSSCWSVSFTGALYSVTLEFMNLVNVTQTRAKKAQK